LCGSGAKNLIDNGEAFLQITVQCMGRSHPYSVQVEGFRLAQCLVVIFVTLFFLEDNLLGYLDLYDDLLCFVYRQRNEENCLKLLNLFGEPIVNAIVSEMCKQNSLSGKAANDQVSLLKEACRLALITRWAGKHHIYFWKQGIDRVLLGLLLEDFHDNLYQHFLSLEELMSIAHKVLSSNYLLVLRGYIWDILGWLATHCGEDFNPNTHGNELHLNILITCSW
jgi:hypothetical protein